MIREARRYKKSKREKGIEEVSKKREGIEKDKDWRNSSTENVEDRSEEKIGEEEKKHCGG